MTPERGSGFARAAGTRRPPSRSAHPAARWALLALAAGCFLAAALLFLRPRATGAPAPAVPVVPAAPSGTGATAVRLSVPAAAVPVGALQVLSGTGWEPGARVTVATVNAAGTVARYAWTVADAQGAFSHAVALPEPGLWTHRV